MLIYHKRLLQCAFKNFCGLIACIWLIGALGAFAAYAQTSNISSSGVQNADASTVAPVTDIINVDDLLKNQQVTLQGLQDNLTQLKNNFQDKQNDDAALIDIRAKLQSLATDTVQQALLLRQPLIDVNLKLDQLGTAPASGEEPKEKVDDRKRMLDQKSQINKQVTDLEATYISANQLTISIVEKRRELFSSSLTRRVVFNEAFFTQVNTARKDSGYAVSQILSNYAHWVVNNRLLYLGLALLGACFVGASIIFIGRHLSHRVKKTVYDDESGISYLRLVLIALLTCLTATIAEIFFFETFAYIFTYNYKFPTDIEVMFDAFDRLCFLVVLIASIARALFRPSAKDLALVDITPIAARKLNIILCTIALVFGINWFFDDAYQVVSAALSLSIAKDFFGIVVIGLLIVLIAFVKPGKKEQACSFVPFPRFIRYLIIIGGVTPILCAIFGYVGMGRFIIQQIVVGFAFLILIYLGLSVSRTLTGEGAFAQTRVGQTIGKYFKAGPAALDQLGLLAGVLTAVLVLILCLPPILMQFGLSGDEIFGTLNQILTGFQIGNVYVSITGIAIGIGFFVGFYALFRWFIRCFDNVILARGHVDAGIRNSVKTIAGYGAVALAGMIGMSAAGLNLSSLALIAGGLSLGIGFGLQNIVQNFVSGLILLAERPFKVGDYVEAGTVQGTVRRINVRATEIETGQRNTIIVPNSTLINGNVGNWTLRNKIGRIDLTFTIPLAFKPEEVPEKLLAIANSVEAIMRKPEPSVEFVSFDDLGLVFTLYVYVPDITSTTAIKNTIRMGVFNAFYADWSKAVQAWEQRNFPQYNDVAVSEADEGEHKDNHELLKDNSTPENSKLPKQKVEK